MHVEAVAVKSSAVTAMQVHHFQGEGQVIKVRDDNFYDIRPYKWRENMEG